METTARGFCRGRGGGGGGDDCTDQSVNAYFPGQSTEKPSHLSKHSKNVFL